MRALVSYFFLPPEKVAADRRPGEAISASATKELT
jgi:hypothetical protein